MSNPYLLYDETNANNLSDRTISKENLQIPFQRTWMKWFGLFLLCMYPFGRFYCFGNPQSLEANLMTDLGLSSLEYNLLYSAYAFPNFVLPLVGGYLGDRIGLRKTYFLCSGLVTGGQLLFWFGCLLKSYPLLLGGRFLFGFGGESLYVIRYPMMVKWFNKNELGFASGLALFTSRLGSLANSLITPNIAERTGSITIPTFLGFLICIFCFFCGLLWLTLDEISDKRRIALGEFDEVKQEVLHQSEVKLLAIFKFKKITWLFAFIALFALSVFISFTNIGNLFLENQYGMSQGDAGDLLSLFYLVTGILTPIFGLMADKYGRKLYGLECSYFLLFSTFVLFYFIPTCNDCLNGVFPFMVLAVFVALFSGMYWPCVVFLEEKKYMGLLNGFIAIFYNIGEGIFPIIIGLIQDKTPADENQYSGVIIFEGMIAIFGLILVTVLFNWDRKENKGVLNK